MSTASHSYGSSYPYAPSRGDLYSEHGSYISKGPGDVFLFSPSLCSRVSQESTSQSSSSFDGLSYICSPTDVSNSANIFSPSALPSSAPSGSPTMFDLSVSGREPKPITRLSPSTPFQRLFNSSPGGFWQADDQLLSPISRRSGSMHDLQCGSDEDADGTEDEEDLPISGKIESLLDYQKAQDIPDSPQDFGRASSPSSLSSLSSRSSSPSIALSSLPLPSSQTSRGMTIMPCSPSDKVTALSPLGSPFKVASLSSDILTGLRPTRRSARLPAMRMTRRSLAAEILNQLGSHSSSVARATRPSSPLKLSSPPAPFLCDSDDENYAPNSKPTRKRARRSQRSAGSQTKRRRTAMSTSAVVADLTPSSSDSAPTSGDASTYPNRAFPLSLPIHANFPLFYRQFPVSSVIDVDLADIKIPTISDGTPNAPRDGLDLYTPRFVKGRGTSKVGLCPICHESVERGGEGKKLWLSMKFSAFNYHMQYAHGISPATGRPFSPPLAFRVVPRPNAGRLEKTQMMEGKCHKCKKWVAVEGIKDVPTKVKEIFWWKHAATCHQGSTIEGECDVFVEDKVYEAVCSIEDAEGETDTEECA
ncbi:hypothetical protein GY45DRAFT_1305770 [Cubamyces sp. BRFM 1775]|nr:hypothetical protein GY45DRAFT_1305770 [Cubamyces sp. BRFM 1775]